MSAVSRAFHSLTCARTSAPQPGCFALFSHAALIVSTSSRVNRSLGDVTSGGTTGSHGGHSAASAFFVAKRAAASSRIAIHRSCISLDRTYSGCGGDVPPNASLRRLHSSAYVCALVFGHVAADTPSGSGGSCTAKCRACCFAVSAFCAVVCLSMDWLDRFIRAYRSSGRRCCDAYASASFTALRRRWIRAETPSTWIDLPKTSQPSFDRADENSFLPMRKAAFHTNARISSVNVVLVLRQSAYWPARGSTSGHANMRMSRKPAKSTRQKSGMADVHIGNSCIPASLFACARGLALRMLFMSIMTGRYACGAVFTKYATGLASEYTAHVSAASRSVVTHGSGCTRAQNHVSTGIHLPESYSCCDARRCVAVAYASLFAALASATPPVAMAASLRTLTTVRLNCATMLLFSAVITCAAEKCVTLLNSLPGKSAGSMDARTCAFTPSISSQSSALNVFDCLFSGDATNLATAARMLASRKGMGRCRARRCAHQRARNSCKSAVAR